MYHLPLFTRARCCRDIENRTDIRSPLLLECCCCHPSQDLAPLEHAQGQDSQYLFASVCPREKATPFLLALPDLFHHLCLTSNHHLQPLQHPFPTHHLQFSHHLLPFHRLPPRLTLQWAIDHHLSLLLMSQTDRQLHQRFRQAWDPSFLAILQAPKRSQFLIGLSHARVYQDYLHLRRLLMTLQDQCHFQNWQTFPQAPGRDSHKKGMLLT